MDRPSGNLLQKTMDNHRFISGKTHVISMGHGFNSEPQQFTSEGIWWVPPSNLYPFRDLDQPTSQCQFQLGLGTFRHRWRLFFSSTKTPRLNSSRWLVCGEAWDWEAAGGRRPPFGVFGTMKGSSWWHWNWGSVYPPVIKHGVLENGPLIGDFPIKPPWN